VKRSRERDRRRQALLGSIGQRRPSIQSVSSRHLESRPRSHRTTFSRSRPYDAPRAYWTRSISPIAPTAPSNVSGGEQRARKDYADRRSRPVGWRATSRADHEAATTGLLLFTNPGSTWGGDHSAVGAVSRHESGPRGETARPKTFPDRAVRGVVTGQSHDHPSRGGGVERSPPLPATTGTYIDGTFLF
jgi:hypothetical protein